MSSIQEIVDSIDPDEGGWEKIGETYTLKKGVTEPIFVRAYTDEQIKDKRIKALQEVLALPELIQEELVPEDTELFYTVENDERLARNELRASIRAAIERMK